MSDDDPFEEFEPVDDREGDPFEALEGPDASDDTEAAKDSTDGERAASPTDVDSSDAAVDPFAELGPDEGDPLGDEHDADDPFSDMEGREGDPFGGGDSVFEHVDVDTIDADTVWADLTGDGDASESAGESRYAEVSKHRYCEQCEHFSSPPDVHCTNDEAEILEFTDMEHVRLLDCPVVAEQRQLADDG